MATPQLRDAPQLAAQAEQAPHLASQPPHPHPLPLQVLSIFPTTIRRRILQYLYMKHLRACYLFRKTPQVRVRKGGGRGGCSKRLQGSCSVSACAGCQLSVLPARRVQRFLDSLLASARVEVFMPGQPGESWAAPACLPGCLLACTACTANEPCILQPPSTALMLMQAWT